MSIQEFPATTAAHRHRWEQRWESTTGTCTFKLFSCDCRQFKGRHYGCHGNAEMSDALLAQLKDRGEKLAAVAGLQKDLDALLRDAHKGQYRQTILDYPPANSFGNCHSLCRHVFLIKSELDRILKGGD